MSPERNIFYYLDQFGRLHEENFRHLRCSVDPESVRISLGTYGLRPATPEELERHGIAGLRKDQEAYIRTVYRANKRPNRK